MGTHPIFESDFDCLTEMDNSPIHSAKRLQSPLLESNVWTEAARLCKLYPNAVNMGQGFPNFPPEDYIPNALAKAPLKGTMANQYSRDFGKTEFVEALADFYSPLFGFSINPLANILVTTGAYAALHIAIQSFIDPGDEVIIIEPAFDCYAPMVDLAGGIPKYISLIHPKGVSRSENWVLDLAVLEQMVSKKTKAIILNNPNNPLGKVWHRDELESLSKVIIRHNLLCISDEVYEHLVYKPLDHVRIGSLDGMENRTITIGSAGKSWSVTGWKTGWAIGAQNLIKPMQSFWVNTMASGVTPVQAALAECFRFELDRAKPGHPIHNPDSHFWQLSQKKLKPKLEQMIGILKDLGLEPIVPEGTYYMMADATQFKQKLSLDDKDTPWDIQFMRWLAKERGIIVIPVSAFYGLENRSKDTNSHFVRFCFAKNDETISRLELCSKTIASKR